MKIRFIKEYVAVAPDTNLGIVHRYRFGETKEIKGYTAKWLIDNGFAEEVKESGWWKPEYDEKYFFVDNNGDVEADRWFASSVDRGRFAIGNCFKTRKATERWRDYLKATTAVRQDEGVLTQEQASEAIAQSRGVFVVINDPGCRGCYVSSTLLVWPGDICFDTQYHAQNSLSKHLNEWNAIANYDWSRE